MITKIKPSTSTVLPTFEGIWGSSPIRSTATYKSGESRISYADGPKYVGYHCNWKPCEQITINSQPAPVVWRFLLQGHRPAGYSATYSGSYRLPPVTTNYAVPTSQPRFAEAWNKVHDALDLNARDPVLLYSGVLQAVPLVGGALKFTSVLNRAARRLSKSFKQQPFTTVVKSLISADFIDRFVISPTIDDARKFLDAHNHVVRIMNTMYARSSGLPTALEAEVTDNSISRSTNETYYIGPSSSNIRPKNTPRVFTRNEVGVFNTTKVFLLAELDYNTTSVDPIKLWAARCGILSPLDSVWDLVPFSFVIDYFTRAGDFISGLGQQMSSQDGLKGKIRTIIGSWSTYKAFNGLRRTVTGVDNIYLGPSSWGWITDAKESEIVSSRTEYGSYRFVRAPSNPWRYPMQEPSGLLHWDLTKVRARTLLELVIQAKL